VRLRHELTTAGLDVGPSTLTWHLLHDHQQTVSVSTVARVLTRQTIRQVLLKHPPFPVGLGR
jgi:hypothetical protein